MYKKLLKEDFPLEEDNLGVYRNIRKSGLYAIVSRPSLRPYNDENIWVFSHVDEGTAAILSKLK